MLEYIQLLLISVILGGMVTFQILFAPFIFIKLENEVARPFIRQFFPFYYLYFGLLGIFLVVVAYFRLGQIHDVALMIIFVLLSVGFVISRQIFMPLANKATDEGRNKDFTVYHRITVLINTFQLLSMLIALWLVL